MMTFALAAIGYVTAVAVLLLFNYAAGTRGKAFDEMMERRARARGWIR